MSTLNMIQVALELFEAFTLFLCATAILYQLHRTRLSKLTMALLYIHTCTLLLDCCAYYFRGKITVTALIMTRVSNFFVLAMTHLYPLLLAHYFYFLIESHKVEIKFQWRKYVAAISVISIAVLVVNNFVPIVYRFTANNLYQRMPGFYIIAFTAAFSSLINCIAVLMYSKYLYQSEKIICYAYMFITMVSVIVQCLVYGISLVNTAATLSLLFMFFSYELTVNTLAMERELKLKSKESQLLRAELRSTAEQIRPHFLFNSITTIRSLCYEQPEAAAEALGKLGVMLRNNKDQFSVGELISVEKELDTVESYLFIQKLRFGDRLTVVKEIAPCSFRIPPYCIQTLVDMAVSSEIELSEKNGTILLSISESASHYTIYIRDNGQGVYHSENESRELLATADNIRQRLDYYCHGTLDIIHHHGEGTEYTIVLPKESGL